MNWNEIEQKEKKFVAMIVLLTSVLKEGEKFPLPTAIALNQIWTHSWEKKVWRNLDESSSSNSLKPSHNVFILRKMTHVTK